MPFCVYMSEENTGLALLVLPEGNIILPKERGMPLTEKEIGCVQGNAGKKDIMFPSELANNLYIYRHIIFMNMEKGWRE